MKYKPLDPEIFKAIYSKVPRLCVDLIIKDGRKVLLTKRIISSYKGYWHLPGGTVLFREGLEEAVKRVAKRELNLDVRIEKFLGFIEFTGKSNGNYHPVSIVFLVSPKSLNIKLNKEADEYNFFESPPEKTISEQEEFLNKLID